jgi:hypothetical protein
MMKSKEQNLIIQVSGFELSRSDERIFKSSYQMLDVVQLKHAHDSLKREIDFYSRDFIKTLVKNSFFKLNSTSLNFRPEGYQQLYSRGRTPPETIKENVLPKATISQTQKAAARKAAARSRADLERIKIAVDDTNRTIPDTMRTVKRNLKKISDFDSLFASFSIEDRERLISSAINQVSANHYLVVGTTERMDYENRQLRKY